MVSQARKIIPTLNSSDFTILGKPGIRAQLFNKKEAQLEMDFVVRKTDNSLHILNAVSPGWTSALSFADYIVEQYF
jgi:L-2-hydroxyglutarate oxidase LhgO